MGMYNLFEEVSANVVNVTTGGIQKNYNKTDLKVSKTDQQVFVYYYTDGTNKTVASWNEFQAQEYGYTLSELKSRIDGILVPTAPSFSGLNISSVPEYASQTDAIADGLKNGDVYRLPKASDKRLLAVVFSLIQSYTAGISTITFTPDGSNGWDVEFLTAATLDAPIGVVVSSIDTKVRFFNISGETTLHTGTASATNVQFNTGANGAGIYELRTTYNLSNGDNFSIIRLISVDATDNILYEINSLGAVVNSVNGLSIDVSGQLTQVGVNYGVQWVAMDSLGNLLQLLGTTVDAVLALPVATSQVLMIIYLGAEFSLYTGDPVTNIMVTIN